MRNRERPNHRGRYRRRIMASLTVAVRLHLHEREHNQRDSTLCINGGG